MLNPPFRVKLDAIGYGFLIPIFFITSGIRFDLDALRDDLSTLVLVPVFLLALLVVRGVPALVYRHQVESLRSTVAAGLLQATSLPFIVTASMIGVDIGALTPATGSAFVAARLLSALLFPVISLALLRPTMTSPMPAGGGRRGAAQRDVRTRAGCDRRATACTR